MNYDIIGDIHCCYYEFVSLLKKLSYKEEGDLFIPPPGRKLISVGDVVDRGPNPALAFTLIKNMCEAGHAEMVMGNHEFKILRWAKGNNVKIFDEQEKTINSFKAYEIQNQTVINFFSGLPFYIKKEEFIVVHASWKNFLYNMDPFDMKCKSVCLFGPTTGREINGLPERIDWAAERNVENNSRIIIYGHQPHKEVYQINKTYCIDTGCVFGNKLTVLRWPEKELVSVDAFQKYSEKEL